jgi:hypothetical protein
MLLKARFADARLADDQRQAALTVGDRSIRLLQLAAAPTGGLRGRASRADRERSFLRDRRGTQPATARSALRLRGGVQRFLDNQVARATATFVRHTTEAEAILVPSIGVPGRASALEAGAVPRQTAAGPNHIHHRPPTDTFRVGQ